MKRSIIALPLVMVSLAFAVFLFSDGTSGTLAQGPMPPNDRARGLVYDGLKANDPDCPGAFKVAARGSGRIHCTHGPDAAPATYDVSKSVPPVKKSSTTSTALARSLPPATGSTYSVTMGASGVACDGDGASGNRVQVIYAHGSDVADRYATYLSSFQQWIASADAIYNTSASQTGGTRHIRFVTDANCNLVIPDVTLSPYASSDFGEMIGNLAQLGYNLPNRKYIVFMDAHAYCGIANIRADDSNVWTNANNTGGTYGRIDAGCWSDVIPAHELNHQLGGVQLSAPHSSGEWHCYDGYDDMCRPTNGTALKVACTYAGAGNLMDCGHDDYYSTNPARHTYLASHWNTAYNSFLIQPYVDRIDSLAVGTKSGKTFTAANSFTAGSTIFVQAHVTSGTSVDGATVGVAVNQPNGSALCTLLLTTDGTGTVLGSCKIPATAPKGTWRVQVTNFGKLGYNSDTANSVTNLSFTVQ